MTLTQRERLSFEGYFLLTGEENLEENNFFFDVTTQLGINKGRQDEAVVLSQMKRV